MRRQANDRGWIEHEARLWGVCEGLRRLQRRLRDEGVQRSAGEVGGGGKSEGTGEDLARWLGEMLPGHFRLRPGKMHRWMLERFAQMTHGRGARLNVMGPRGSAKSTVATLGYVLWCVAHRHEPYVWIVSETGDQARGHLNNLRGELEGNARLQRLYGEACLPGGTWRDDFLVTRAGTAIEAVGRGERTRGRRFHQYRPTLIVCDDLVGERQGYSARERKRTREWFWGTLLPAGEARTNVVHLCTPQHGKDLSGELLAQGGWESGRFAAIEKWPQRMDLWNAWERMRCRGEQGRQEAELFYLERAREMEEGVELGWPERDSTYGLFCLRSELGGALFEREMQGRTPEGLEAEFHEGWLEGEIWFDAWPEKLALKVIAVDPSDGKSTERGDYSAIVLAGLDTSNVWHVDADLARRSVMCLAEDCVRLQSAFRADAVVLETNVYRDLLEDLVRREGVKQGESELPIWCMENRVSKRRRIQRLGPLLAQGRMRFLRGSAGAGLLLDQLRMFPHGEHDDGPDALEMAVRMGREQRGDS